MDYYDLVDVIGLCAEPQYRWAIIDAYIRTYLVIVASGLDWVAGKATTLKKRGLNLAYSDERLSTAAGWKIIFFMDSVFIKLRLVEHTGFFFINF